MVYELINIYTNNKTIYKKYVYNLFIYIAGNYNRCPAKCRPNTFSISTTPLNKSELQLHDLLGIIFRLLADGLHTQS